MLNLYIWGPIHEIYCEVDGISQGYVANKNESDTQQSHDIPLHEGTCDTSSTAQGGGGSFRIGNL